MARNVKLQFTILAGVVGKKVDLAKKAVAIEILKNLIFSTPVDTGRARNNWFVGLGSPIRKVNIGTESASQEKSGQAQLNRGNAKITKANLGQDIFLSNNLNYIVKLNNGSSAQAPAGFVERAVQAGLNLLRVLKL